MGNGRILVVDDQRYFRELCEGLLTEAGYSVATSSSAEEALQALDADVFDLVITDLVMPVMSGTDLVFRVKERDPNQEVLVITGVVDVKSAVEAMRLGASDYLLKPFDRDQLCATVQAVMSRSRLREEHDRLLAENLEHLSERGLLERALELMEAETEEVLAERTLAAFCEEAGAQGGVLWRAGESGTGFKLAWARGLVRAEEEPELLAPADLPEGLLRAGAVTALRDETDPAGAERRALWVAVRVDAAPVAFVRLTDKVGGERFDPIDASWAEKLAVHASTAYRNFERSARSPGPQLQNPETGAYRREVLHDVARSEIEKANRFGRRFGLLEVALEPLDPLRRAFGEDGFRDWHARLARHLGRFLRSTDMLAVDDEGHLVVVLAETDTLGAAIFKQRVREALAQGEPMAALTPALRPRLSLGAVTYPSDASELESLLRTLSERRQSDLRWRDRHQRLRELSFGSALAELLEEEGSEERTEDGASLLRFVLAERGRRPQERNWLFTRPGAEFAVALGQGLERRADPWAAGELLVLGEPANPDLAAAGVSWVAPENLEPGPAFAISFGDSPPYVWVAQSKGAETLHLFHSADRALAETLCFRLLEELPVNLSTGLGS